MSSASARTTFDVQWADLRGRIDPTGVDWPLKCELLSVQEASEQLLELAQLRTTIVDRAKGLETHSLSFQPCRSYRSQDRYVVRPLTVNGEEWSLSAIFDGHIGHATVDHAAQNLPSAIQDAIQAVVIGGPGYLDDPTIISSALVSTIAAFDQAITDDVLALFPGGLDPLPNLTDDEIRKVINDTDTGGANHAKVRLCMDGTTALIALVDPSRENLWVANLGDCDAVLLNRSASGEVTSDPLTTRHNGGNPAEIVRIHEEHPGEPECTFNDRLLGAFAVFRALGDTLFKLPSVFCKRILMNVDPTDWPDHSKWDASLARNVTPPYFSTQAEVTHRRLGSLQPGQNFLLMASDGLAERYEGREEGYLPTIQESAARYDGAKGCGNLALQVLKDAILANNIVALSRVLALQVNIPWIDDITILVQELSK